MKKFLLVYLSLALDLTNHIALSVVIETFLREREKLRQIKLVEEDGFNIYDVLDAHYETKLAAVRQNANVLEIFRPEDITYEMCEVAVKQKWYALEFVPHIDSKLFRLAIVQNKDAMRYAPPAIRERFERLTM